MEKFYNPDVRDTDRINKLVRFLLPKRSQGVNPVVYPMHTNRIGSEVESAELGLLLANGDRYSISVMLETIFFEQIELYTINHFERTPDNKMIPRDVPLTNLAKRDEQAMCYNTIAEKANATPPVKMGRLAYIYKRVEELFDVDLDTY